MKKLMIVGTDDGKFEVSVDDGEPQIVEGFDEAINMAADALGQNGQPAEPQEQSAEGTAEVPETETENPEDYNGTMPKKVPGWEKFLAK